jgi:tetratricopeptide (TPR) repeat protein
MGAGLEGYRIVFPSVVDADYVRRHGRDVVTDRAHDGALDLAVATGIPGGVAYLVAAGWLTVLGVRAVRRQDAVMAGVGMGVIGYLAQQVFLFPTLEIDPVFWLFAGLLVVAETAPRLDLGRWPAVPALLLAVTLAAAGGLEMAADRHARQALEVAATGDLRRAVDEALAATRLRPEGFRYRLLVADIAVQATEGLDIARSQTDAARRLSPLDPAVALAQAEVLLRRALATEAAVDLDPARQAFEDLSRSDPLHPRVWLRLGLAAALQGDAGPAEQAWKRAEDLAPAAVEATLSLARLYVETGRDDDAREALERARRIDPDAAAATEEQLGSKG